MYRCSSTPAKRLSDQVLFIPKPFTNGVRGDVADKKAVKGNAGFDATTSERTWSFSLDD